MHDQQYLPVNWADGMKINKDHFINQEKAITSQALHTAAALLNDYNYGLLPADPSLQLTPGIFVSLDNQQQVNVRLQHCSLITRGGYFFQFLGEVSNYNRALSAPVPHLSVPFQDLKGRAESFYVILVVDPFDRTPYGMPDADESPVRVPFTAPTFRLELIPVTDSFSNLVGNFHIPVGRIHVDEQRVTAESEYIPPCCMINSHNELAEILSGLEQFYSRMETYMLQIIQKIYQKKQQNDLSNIVLKLCEVLLNVMSPHVAEIRTLSANQPPVFLLNKLACVARVLKNTLDFFIGSGKEELMNYCAEWCQVNQGEFESVLTGLSNHQYNHLDVNAGVNRILQFTRATSTLFSNLSKLDYIGKKKDAGIFVKEDTVSYPVEEPRKRKSFLAD